MKKFNKDRFIKDIKKSWSIKILVWYIFCIYIFIVILGVKVISDPTEVVLLFDGLNHTQRIQVSLIGGFMLFIPFSLFNMFVILHDKKIKSKLPEISLTDDCFMNGKECVFDNNKDFKLIIGSIGAGKSSLAKTLSIFNPELQFYTVQRIQYLEVKIRLKAIEIIEIKILSDDDIKKLYGGVKSGVIQE